MSLKASAGTPTGSPARSRSVPRGSVGFLVCDTVFSPYTAPELEEILHRRADGALYDDATGPGVISSCAATAAQDTGSARQALHLLYKAGEVARANDESRTKTPPRPNDRSFRNEHGALLIPLATAVG